MCVCVCASIVYKYFYIQILKSRSTVIEVGGGEAIIWIRSSYGIFCLKTIVIYAAVKTADIVTWIFFTRSLKKSFAQKRYN